MHNPQESVPGDELVESFQEVTDTDLKRMEDYVVSGDSVRKCFIPADAAKLSNMCLHLIREVRHSRSIRKEIEESN